MEDLFKFSAVLLLACVAFAVMHMIFLGRIPPKVCLALLEISFCATACMSISKSK